MSLKNELNLIDHFLEGLTWPVKTKKGSTVTVTLGPNGLWCGCPRFDYFSDCIHCEEVRGLIAGEGMPKWNIPE
tara:strand:+ start:469 stop:690 length:222 start_codon:yes stop_codon:yes gene_type:complete